MRTQLPRICAMACAALAPACGDAQPTTSPGPRFGAIQAANTTTGPVTPGPSYFHISVDGGLPFILRLDSLRTIDSMESGTHATTIALLRPQCRVPDSSVAVSVVAAETTAVQFAVSCEIIWGFLAVALPTTGPNQPSLLTITLDDSAIGGAAPNAAGLGFPYILAAPHAVGLRGAGGNCTVAEANPQDVVIPLDDTLHVRFTLTCS